MISATNSLAKVPFQRSRSLNLVGGKVFGGIRRLYFYNQSAGVGHVGRAGSACQMCGHSKADKTNTLDPNVIQRCVAKFYWACADYGYCSTEEEPSQSECSDYVGFGHK